MPTPPINARVLADHRIHAIVPFDASSQNGAGSGMNLGALVHPSTSSPSGSEHPLNDWLPASAREALADRFRDTAIWHSQPGQADDTLHPHVRALIEGTDERAHRLVLTDEARKLITEAPQASPDAIEQLGGPNLPRYRLLLLLPRSTESRLLRDGGAVPDTSRPLRSRLAIQLEIHGITLHRFATGLTVADAEIEVQFLDDKRPLEFGMLCEIAFALSHKHELVWEATRGSEAGNLLPVRFDLADILCSLVEAPHATRRSVHRTFLFTAATLADDSEVSCDPQTLHLAASRLARNYTDDYAISGPAQHNHTVTEFENVAMVVAREGACTLIDLAKRPDGLPAAEFLKGFRTRAVEQAYKPLTILALHERAEIVRVTAEAARWVDFGGADKSQVQQLERVSQRALRLRLAYRFSEVGRITQHNAWHRALRDALALDEMIEEMRGDVGAIHDQLRRQVEHAEAERAQNRVKRFKPIAALVAGLVAGDAIFGPVKDTLEKAFGWQAGSVYAALGLMVIVGLLAAVWTLSAGGDRGDGTGA